MPIRRGSTDVRLENDSSPKAMYTCNSVITLHQENTNKIEKKTLLKLVFMQFTFKVHEVVVSGEVHVWGSWSLLFYSTELCCVCD